MAGALHFVMWPGGVEGPLGADLRVLIETMLQIDILLGTLQLVTANARHVSRELCPLSNSRKELTKQISIGILTLQIGVSLAGWSGNFIKELEETTWRYWLDNGILGQTELQEVSDE